MPNPKKKRKKKEENPVLKIIKDITEDTTKNLKKGIEDFSKTVDDTIKNIKFKQDPDIKKLQKADEKTKKKLKQVKRIAEEAKEDAETSRMETEKVLTENIALKKKLTNLESQVVTIRTLFNELNVDLSELKVDISKIKERNLYLLVLILEFEKRIREFIKTELRNLYDKQWWSDGIPSSIQKMVEDKIRRRNLENIIDKMKLLCYSDYTPIIVYNNNWKRIFYRKFPNKDYFESRMEIITNSRNFLFHGNEINEDIEKLKSYLKDLNERINIT